jgi:hypothetical protein
LQYRAASADHVTPGMSIAAIDDILKLRKKISRATAKFTDPKSGVDVLIASPSNITPLILRQPTKR